MGKVFLGDFLMGLSWNVISFGYLDLTLMAMIKGKFERLLGGCTSYLYGIIFNEIWAAKREEKRGRKREMIASLEEQKEVFYWRRNFGS